MEDRVGKHFVLQRGQKVPQGGLSIVCKAVDDRDLSPVAVKFVQAGTDDLTRKLFERETKALRGLNHRNIVRFRDAGVDDTGTYYLVLEWVNRSLKDLLKERPWTSWTEFYKDFVKPLLEGLAHAHLKRLEHRDIKPANILIDDNGQPLLADFGIAKLRGDEPHSEHTVQGFRSGPYSPPELEATIPYVRDVYSVGVVIIQCLTDTDIRDYPQIRPALEGAQVPPDVRELLEACVSFEPSERPRNAIELAESFRELELKRIADRGQQLNLVWLDLTRAATDHLREVAGLAMSATGVLQADLADQVHLEFGMDRDTGERDRGRLLLYGSEYRYSIAVNGANSGRLTIVAVKAVSFEELEAGRRRSIAVPPIFSWLTSRPADLRASERAWILMEELLDKFYESRDNAGAVEDDESNDELFDRWLRVLDARADHARGEHAPLRYNTFRADGRRATFELTEAATVDLVGTEWEIYDPNSGYKFGNGEVIDQQAAQVTLLTSRALAGIPKSASLRPYDAPSAIAINRQRAALVAVKGGLAPNPALKPILLNPASNAQPVPCDIVEWFTELDAAKQEAVRMALGTSEALLVEGPPGTGKTRFIVEAVSQYLRNHPDHRVLIASQTHVAVDNAVERLSASGMGGIVRLAGADESAVATAVRDLLMHRQMPRWADEVRTRAATNISAESTEIGIEVNHARASLVLEQLVSVSSEYERVDAHVEELSATTTDSSDLLTAVDDESRLDELRGRLEHLAERRKTLSSEAQRLLAGDLTIPAQLGSDEARAAISAIIGDSDTTRAFMQRLALQAEWMERIDSDDGLTATFLAGASVVAGTCIGLLRNKVVGKLEFDLCIVDEASRATLTEALVPMARAKRWILVGDTRQLPPSDEDLLRKPELLSEHQLESADIKETLFQRLVDHLPTHSQLMLDEQYRMVRSIGDLISTCFYEGRLRSTRVDGLEGYATFAGAPVLWLDTTALGDRRREQGQGTTSVANRTEAQVLVSQLESIDLAIERGLIKKPNDAPLEVLAIAPYKSQVDDLHRRLASKSFRHLAVSPMSVDAVQGREADLALFSVTRSNQHGRLGFMGPEYWRRINVALSRARYGLTIIGDAGFIRGTSGALRTVLDYVDQHPQSCALRAANT